MIQIAVLLGSPWLGHGRRLESTLAIICLAYGLLLAAHPSTAMESRATSDVADQGYAFVLASVFLGKGVFTGLGVIANINGWRFSRFLRFVGASLGSFIWAYMAAKFTILGFPFAFGSVCAVAFLISSITILGMTLANLPRPGAPGST